MKPMVLFKLALVAMLAASALVLAQGSIAPRQTLGTVTRCCSERDYVMLSTGKGNLPYSVPSDKVLMISAVTTGDSVSTVAQLNEIPAGGSSAVPVSAVAVSPLQGYARLPEGVFIRSGSTVFENTGNADISIHGYLIDKVALVDGEKREFFVVGTNHGNAGYIVPPGKKLIVTAFGPVNLQSGYGAYVSAQDTTTMPSSGIWKANVLPVQGSSQAATLFVFNENERVATITPSTLFGYLVDS
jgi:hypothetical protein